MDGLERLAGVLKLGPDEGVLRLFQTTWRTVAMYLFALIAVILGRRRFLGKASAFDVVVAITLGSILARSIDGSSPLHLTLLAAVVLVGMHRLIATLSQRLAWLGPLVKGTPVLLVQDGRVDLDGMRRAGVGARDLEEAIRLQARGTELARVRAAYLERNGSISVILADGEPKVVEVKVEDGVQIVRVRLE